MLGAVSVDRLIPPMTIKSYTRTSECFGLLVFLTIVKHRI